MFESTTKIQNRSTKGFTLIELLVVVVIVGILAAVALPNFLGQTGKAKTTEASATIDASKTGQESFVNENGQYFTGGTVAAVPAANSDTFAGTVATAGVALSSLQAAIQVNLDATKFADAAAGNGNQWAVATAATATGVTTLTPTSNSNFAINVDGGLSTVTTGTQIRGLAASYLKSQAKVYIDANQTI